MNNDPLDVLKGAGSNFVRLLKAGLYLAALIVVSIVPPWWLFSLLEYRSAEWIAVYFLLANMGISTYGVIFGLIKRTKFHPVTQIQGLSWALCVSLPIALLIHVSTQSGNREILVWLGSVGAQFVAAICILPALKNQGEGQNQQGRLGPGGRGSEVAAYGDLDGVQNAPSTDAVTVGEGEHSAMALKTEDVLPHVKVGVIWIFVQLLPACAMAFTAYNASLYTYREVPELMFRTPFTPLILYYVPAWIFMRGTLSRAMSRARGVSLTQASLSILYSNILACLIEAPMAWYLISADENNNPPVTGAESIGKDPAFGTLVLFVVMLVAMGLIRAATYSWLINRLPLRSNTGAAVSPENSAPVRQPEPLSTTVSIVEEPVLIEPAADSPPAAAEKPKIRWVNDE